MECSFGQLNTRPSSSHRSRSPHGSRRGHGHVAHAHLGERHLGDTPLAREGWVATTRGRSGGLRITDEGAAVTVGTVVRALDGIARVVDCLDPPCPLVTAGCRLQGVLGDAQRAFLATLDEQTTHALAGSR